MSRILGVAATALLALAGSAGAADPVTEWNVTGKRSLKQYIADDFRIAGVTVAPSPGSAGGVTFVFLQKGKTAVRCSELIVGGKRFGTCLELGDPPAN